MKDYALMVYTILMPLVTGDLKAKVYKNTCPEDNDSRPDQFIVYHAGISSIGKIYKDGVAIVRNVDCDIVVYERGDGNAESSGVLADAVEQQLIDRNIPYIRTSTGYIESEDAIQTAFDFMLR
jgi:hypothetical protein